MIGCLFFTDAILSLWWRSSFIDSVQHTFTIRYSKAEFEWVIALSRKLYGPKLIQANFGVAVMSLKRWDFQFASVSVKRYVRTMLDCIHFFDLNVITSLYMVPVVSFHLRVLLLLDTHITPASRVKVQVWSVLANSDLVLSIYYLAQLL